MTRRSLLASLFSVAVAPKIAPAVLNGFARVPLLGEGAAAPFDSVALYSVAHPFTTKFVHLQYSLGFKVKSALWEDDQLHMAKYAESLGRSIRETQERYAAMILGLPPAQASDDLDEDT